MHFHAIGGTLGTYISAPMGSTYHTLVRLTALTAPFLLFSWIQRMMRRPSRNSPYELSLSPIRESASLINAGHAQYSTAFIVFLHWAHIQYDLLASLETITRPRGHLSWPDTLSPRLRMSSSEDYPLHPAPPGQSSNFSNPASRGPAIVALCYIFISLMWPICLLRLYSKVCILR